jgi:hypothetical protein
MNPSKPFSQTQTSFGDTAIDGLIDGTLAGGAMALYLISAAILSGQDPLKILAGFDLGQWTSPVQGAVLHLAAAAMYGLIFSVAMRLIWRGRSISPWASQSIGVGYGLLLWLIAPSLSRGSIDALLRVVVSAHILIAHVIYGLVIGLRITRRRAA